MTDDLKQRALEATPGPWAVEKGDHSHRFVCVTDEDDRTIYYRYGAGAGVDADRDEANAAYIAAANPARILQLIAENEALQARVERLEGAAHTADSEMSMIEGAVAGLSQDFDQFDAASKKLGSNAARALAKARSRIFEGIALCVKDARAALTGASS